MSRNRIYRNDLPHTDSSGRRKREEKELTGRKDWGFTNHYRRMTLQRSTPQPLGEGSENK